MHTCLVCAQHFQKTQRDTSEMSPEEKHTDSTTCILVHTGTCTIKGKHTPKVLTGDLPMESH